MSGTVNFNRTFSQSVALSDLTISDADTNLIVKNTSDSTADDVTVNIKFRDNNDNDAMTIGIQDKVVELKNNCTNGTTKLSSGLKNLTIDEENNISTFNTDLKSNSVQLAGSSAGTLTIDPAATVTTYSVTLPSAQGAANSLLKNDGSGTLTWGSASGSNAWSSFLTVNSGFTDTNTKSIIDLTSFNSGNDEELHILVETDLHANSFTLYKSLIPSMSSAGYTYELGKYSLRYIHYTLSNSGNTLTIQGAGVELEAIKLYSR